MLNIYFNDSATPVHWRLGQKFPVEKNVVIRVGSVEVDGEELKMIGYRLVNLPFSTYKLSTPQRWFGDHAKFIVDFFRVQCAAPEPLEPPELEL